MKHWRFSPFRMIRAVAAKAPYALTSYLAVFATLLGEQVYANSGTPEAHDSIDVGSELGNFHLQMKTTTGKAYIRFDKQEDNYRAHLSDQGRCHLSSQSQQRLFSQDTQSTHGRVNNKKKKRGCRRHKLLNADGRRLPTAAHFHPRSNDIQPSLPKPSRTGKKANHALLS